MGVELIPGRPCIVCGRPVGEHHAMEAVICLEKVSDPNWLLPLEPELEARNHA